MDSASLSGKTIVFTGRLATMSRAQARQTISDRGGTVATRVSNCCNLIVVGSDGWPLRTSGKLTATLEKAERLQKAGTQIQVVTEASFLKLIGLHDSQETIRRTFSIEQLSRMLNISGLRLRRWIKAGLLEPAVCEDSLPCFDFAEVTKAKMIDRLLRSGRTKQQAAESLLRLRRWVPDDDRIALHIHSLVGSLAIRNDANEMIDEWGQYRFDFDHESNMSQVPSSNRPENRVVRIPQNPKAMNKHADALFDQAYNYQHQGDNEQAVMLYEGWLTKFGRDSCVLFNLGNAYADCGQTDLAIRALHECVELEPMHCLAWNNLALCRIKQDDSEGAIEALRAAIELDPLYADAIYNLADILDECGKTIQANGLWKEYVSLVKHGPHSEYARCKLLKSSVKETVSLQLCLPMDPA